MKGGHPLLAGIGKRLWRLLTLGRIKLVLLIGLLIFVMRSSPLFLPLNLILVEPIH